MFQNYLGPERNELCLLKLNVDKVNLLEKLKGKIIKKIS